MLPNRRRSRLKDLLWNETRADTIGAAATGLFLGTFMWLLSSVSDSRLSIVTWARDVALSITVYTATTLLLHKIWKGLPRRLMPAWLAAAILGTLVLTSFTLVPKLVTEWDSPQRVEATFSEFLWVRLESANSVFLVFCLVGAFIMAAVHYAPKIVGAILQRHGSSIGPFSEQD